MKEIKKCRVICLPHSQGIIHRNNEHPDIIQVSDYFGNDKWTNEHLYILSDDKIVVGDFVYIPDGGGEIRKVMSSTWIQGDEKKVIASTDSSMEITGLDKDFISEWVDSGGKIEWVEIEWVNDSIPTLMDGRHWNDKEARDPNGTRPFYMKDNWVPMVVNNCLVIKKEGVQATTFKFEIYENDKLIAGCNEFAQAWYFIYHGYITNRENKDKNIFLKNTETGQLKRMLCQS